MFHVGALWGYKIKAHIITRPRSHPSSCFDFSLYWWLIGLFCFCFAALLPQSNSLIVRGPLRQGVPYIWTDHTIVLQQCDPPLIISHWSSHELLCRWLCGAEAAAAILLLTDDCWRHSHWRWRYICRSHLYLSCTSYDSASTMWWCNTHSPLCSPPAPPLRPRSLPPQLLMYSATNYWCSGVISSLFHSVWCWLVRRHHRFVYLSHY